MHRYGSRQHCARKRERGYGIDLTYIDTAIGQISGNTDYSDEYKEGIIEAMESYASEEKIERAVRRDKRRFFYNSSTSAIDEAVRKAIPEAQWREWRCEYTAYVREVYAALREEGYTPAEIASELDSAEAIGGDNLWITSQLIGQSYVKSGHRYIAGARIY